MAELGNSLSYKILPEESVSIIGSNSKNSAGDLYAIDVNLKIASTRSKWIKRNFDILFAIILLAFSPILIWITRNKGNFFRNVWKVLKGELSWVGYYQNKNEDSELKLPTLKKGVLSPMDYRKSTKGLTGNKLNLLYAKNYSLENDITLVLKNFKDLGKTLD